MTASTPLNPGDLDRMRFAVYEAADVSTRGVINRAGLGWERCRAALDELLLRGEVRRTSGHHHGNGDLCCCTAGEDARLPRLTHWYVKRP